MNNSTIISIGFDYKTSMSNALAEMESKLKGFEKNHSGQKIEYKITGNKSQLETILKQIAALKPESLQLNFDDSLFRKKLNNLSSILESSGASMAEKFSNSIRSNLGGIDFQNIIKNTLGEGVKLNPTNLKETAKEIRGNIDLIKNSINTNDILNINTKTIEKLVSHYRELASISEYLKQNFPKTQSYNTEKISKEFGNLFNSDILKSAASKMTSEFEKEFELVRNFVLQIQNMLSGDFKSSGMDKYISVVKSEISELENKINSLDVNKVKEKLIEAFRVVSNESKRTKTDISAFLNIADQFKRLGGNIGDISGFSKEKFEYLYDFLGGKNPSIKIGIDAEKAKKELSELKAKKDNLEKNLNIVYNTQKMSINNTTNSAISNNEIQAVNSKTEAINKEAQAMSSAAFSEISSIQKIIDKVNELKQIIASIDNEKIHSVSKINTSPSNNSSKPIVQEQKYTSDVSKLSAEKTEIEKITSSVNTLKTAFHSKTEAIVQEETQMRQSASKEAQSLRAVQNAANEVQNAISSLTKSIANSEINIRQSIGKEVSAFNTMLEKARTFASEISSIANIKIPEIKVSSIKSDNSSKVKNSITREINSMTKAAEKAPLLNMLAKALNDIAAALIVIDDCINIPDIFKGLNANKNAGANLQNIASALNKIKISLKGLPKNGSNFLKGISDIVKESESLKNLSVIIKESTSKINEAKKAVNQNNDTSNFQSKASQMLKGFETNFSLSKISAEFDALKRSISIISDNNDLKKFTNQLSELKSKADSFDSINKVLSDTAKKMGKFNFPIGTELSKEFSLLDSKIKTLNQDLQNGVINIDTYNNKTKKLFDTFQRRIKLGDGKLIDTTNIKSFEEAKLAALDYAKSIGTVKQVLSYNEYPDKNNFYKMAVQIRETSGAVKNLAFIYDNSMKKMSVSSKYLKNEASNFGKAIDSIKSKVGQLATYWTAMYINPYQFINVIRKAVRTITELDTALVDLRKTAKMSSSELTGFYYDANDTAKQMGVSTKEILSQSAAWSRLGYSNKESATEMAKLSSQFASISPGLDVDNATNGLVSVMKAFDKDVDDVKEGIMSKINIIGNNFATNNAEIVTGLQKSSAAMAAMGDTMEDTIALFTAGQEILQDENSMGTALRSISMRIRGYDEETEQLSDDLKNITGDVIDLTKVASNNNQGISLFTDESQTHYKSIVQYLGEIADIYDELGEKNRQNLLEKLFGKHRAQAGAAILTNFEQVRAALKAMENSAGSADKEMSVIEKSLEYKINALKETWVGIFQDTASREALGGIVDALY